MAQAIYSQPGPHPSHDPAAIELSVLRAKCTRIQTERDKFKEALWTLRGHFSALQTHAEGLELENGELKDVLSMRGINWGEADIVDEMSVQERLRSPNTPTPPSVPGPTPDRAPCLEPSEAHSSTLPKPLMRMQEFIEGSSNSTSAAAPSSALTVGSMGPPPSPLSSPLRFQASQLPEPARSHSPNLPRSRTLAPVGPPSQYKKSNGKRKAAATPRSASAGLSTMWDLRSASAKRPLEDTSSLNDEVYASHKKPRTASTAPQGIRSMVSLSEDTDPTPRARFNSIPTRDPSPFSLSQTSTSSNEDRLSDTSTQDQDATMYAVQQTNLTPNLRVRTPSPSQQPSPPPSQHPTPQRLGLEVAGMEAAPYVISAEAWELAAKGPHCEATLTPKLSEDATPAANPQVNMEEEGAEPESEAQPSQPPTPLPEQATQPGTAVKRRAAALTNRGSTQVSTASSPTPSTTGTRVTRSSRDHGEDLHGKHRRAKTHWDPVTGQRIQVGPPRGVKPTTAHGARKESASERESKKLVISIHPRKVRGGSVKK